MVKHIILWTLKEEYKGEACSQIKAGIKEGLEGLKGRIPGLIDIKVNTEPLASSNCDLMLDSSFEDEASLKGYAVHPEHVEVANTRVRPYTASRVCMDFEKWTPGTGSPVHFEMNRFQEGETVDYRRVDRDTLVGMGEDELLTKRVQKFVKELSGAAVVAPA